MCSLALLLYVHFLLTLFCFSSSQPLCHDHESTSLLQFEESFFIDKTASGDRLAYPKVTFWTRRRGTSDCCFWDGVDLATAFSMALLALIASFSTCFISRVFILQITIQLLSNTRCYQVASTWAYLNLSSSVFSGQIPFEVSELSKLSSLDLSLSIDPLSQGKLLELHMPNFESLIFNLTSLEALHLSYVDISSTVPNSLANFSSLRSLLLKDCGLKGEFPVEIFQLPNLQVLILGFNDQLTGNLPPFKQSSSLELLKLAKLAFLGIYLHPLKNLLL